MIIPEAIANLKVFAVKKNSARSAVRSPLVIHPGPKECPPMGSASLQSPLNET